MARNLAKAEAHLVVLKRVCPLACEERDMLAGKIEQYRASAKQRE